MQNFRIQLTRRGLVASAMAMGMTRLNASAGVIYVSSSQGTDLPRAGARDRPYRTLSRALRAAVPGSTVALRRGDVWDEMIEVLLPGIVLTAFGEGPRPLISGAGRRHGVLVRGERNQLIGLEVSNALNGIYVNGPGASAEISDCVVRECGSGIVAGNLGWISSASDVECRSCTQRLGAGDGIQISEDALKEMYRFNRIKSTNNEKSGINFKMGECEISESAFTENGECGVLAQIHATKFYITSSDLSSNNRADNGTFNMGLEDNIHMISHGNMFADPWSGLKMCNNVNLSGGSRLVSIADEYVETDNKANIGSTLRLDGKDNAAGIELLHASIYKASPSWVVDAFGSGDRSNIHVRNSAIDAKNAWGIRCGSDGSRTECLSVLTNIRKGRFLLQDDGGKPIVFPPDIRFLEGNVFDPTRISRRELALPLDSPGRGAGSVFQDQVTDRTGKPFGVKPNLGARA